MYHNELMAAEAEGGTSLLVDNKISRREFLEKSVKWAGALTAATVFTTKLAPFLGDAGFSSAETEAVGEYDYLFQVDLPQDYALLKKSWLDNVGSISRAAKVPLEQLRRENGIGSDGKIANGEFLLVPISPAATARYVENDDPSLEKQLTVRAARNPSLLPEQDLADQEVMILNTLVRWAEKMKQRYFGNIDTTRGFARLMRATSEEMSFDPANVSGQVSTMPACSFPLAGGEQVEATIGCKSGEARAILLYPGQSSLKSYDYFESLRPGYGLEQYLTLMANMVLHERLHLAIWPDLVLPPGNLVEFDNHRLIYAVGSLAYDVYPDKGYVVDGHQVSGGQYSIDSVEWYLVRQNPEFFKKFLAYCVKYYKKDPPAPEVVDEWIKDIDPNLSHWKQMYDAPISAGQPATEGKEFVWTKEVGASAEITWAVPTYSVRWPHVDEAGWLVDYGFKPVRNKDGMLLYRSWKVIGVSKAGEVPDYAKKTGAVPFTSDKPEYFSYTANGEHQISPTAEAAYSIGEWK